MATIRKPKPAPGRRQLLTETAAADYLGATAQELRSARWKGTGRFALLEFFKMGRSVRYDLADLDRYLDTCRIVPQPVARHHVEPEPAGRAAEPRKRGRPHKSQPSDAWSPKDIQP